MPELPLFDKQINLTFTRADGTTVVIETPPTGRKPSIRISGQFVSQITAMNIELRLWNFVSDTPLANFGTLQKPGSVVITAGYRGALHTSINGTVINSYNEQPGPDSVTVFLVQVGIGEAWITTAIGRNYLAGQSLQDVLQDIASHLGMNLKYYADPSLVLPIAVNWNGMAKNLLDKLADLFKVYDTTTQFIGLRIVPFGSDLYCYRGDQGTAIVYELQYIAHAMHSGPGMTIQGPWLPAIRPGDFVRVDPKYFRQDISGAASGSPGNKFQVLMIEFAFCTDTDENLMTLVTTSDHGTQ